MSAPLPPASSRRGVLFALAAIVLAAAALRVHHLDWGLPDLFEEATPFFQGWDMWHWGPPLSVDPDPQFFRYPSLTFYVHFAAQGVAAALFRATGQVASLADIPVAFLADRSPFLFTSRLVTALLGVATIWAVFLLGRRIGGVAAGLAAAALIAVNPFHIESSQHIEVDVPLAFFIAWGLGECVRLLGEPTLRRHLFAGALVGLATSAKYTGALLAAPLLTAHLLAQWDAGGWRRAARLAAAAGAAVAAFAVTSPYVLLDLPLARKEIATEQEHMQRGHFGLDTTLAWRPYAEALPKHVLGWPVTLAAAAGLVVGAMRRRRERIVVATFVVVYAAIVGSWAMHAERYLLPLLPPLVVLATAFLADILRGRRDAFLALATLLLAAPSLAGLPSVYAKAARDPRTAAREWIESRCPQGAFLLMEAWGPDLLEPEDLWKLPHATRTRFLDRRARPLYAIQYLPTYQVQPDLSDAYYDLDLFPDADLVVLSSIVGDRFRAEPERFSQEMRFYREVAQSWTHVAEFRPEPGREGPTITIFAQARHTAPFSRRAEAADASRLTQPLPPGFPGTAFFYARLGMNYETFGFVESAAACYEYGLRSTEFPPGAMESLAAGLGRCRLLQDRSVEAAEEIRRIARACPYAGERRRIEAFAVGLQELAAQSQAESKASAAGGN